LTRVGLLGGAFDPPHGGHLKLARLAFECLNLDELRFVPANSSPGKSAPCASVEARLAMLHGMLLDTPFTVETIELDNGTAGPSYTVDTLETLSKREPGTAWILIVGMDQALDFGNWRNPARILEMASIAVASRPAFAGALPCILAPRQSNEWSGIPGQVVPLPGTEIDISSSQLRERLASANTSGVALNFLPEKVRAVISSENIYR